MKKVKETRGGRRPGSGRKRKNDPLVTYSVHISLTQADLLKKWGGGDLSAGLRWLVNSAKALITKKLGSNELPSWHRETTAP